MGRGGFRRGSGRRLGSRNKIRAEIEIKAMGAAMTPLTYMLTVMADETADDARRDRMAIAAAQYCHPRKADRPVGKKVLAQEAAKAAGQGSEWGSDLDPQKPKPN